MYLNEINQRKIQEDKIAEGIIKKENLEIKRVKNGIILPFLKEGNQYKGGVMDGKRLVEESIQTMMDRTIGGEYFYEEVEEKEEIVLWMGAFADHWGHFLVDMLPHIWYLIRDNHIKIAYDSLPIIASTSQIEGPYWEIFELLGVKKEQLLRVEKPTRFKEVMIAENSFKMGCYYSDEFKELCNRIRDAVPPNQGKVYEKLYFTRYNSRAARYDLGEEKLIKVFRKNGYKIVEPGSISVKKQISYIKNCKEFACVNGTMAHNLQFANDGINVVILNRYRHMTTWIKHQYGIGVFRNLHQTYIDCYYSFLPVGGNGPFLYQVTPELIRYASDHFQYVPSAKKSALRELMELTWYFIMWLEYYDEEKVDQTYGGFSEDFLNEYVYFRNQIYHTASGRIVRKIVNLLATKNRRVFWEIIKK